METTTRQYWLSLLAHSPAPRLAELLQQHLPPAADISWLRRAQTGLVMLQGRSGGSAAASIWARSASPAPAAQIAGWLGHGWVRGSDGQHAELIAQADALLQNPQYYPPLQAALLQPLQQELSARREQSARAAAASKVEFFTMVRGD
ncbi:phosphonate C-P lyase system protein PhnG [Aquitalea magnusonii]|uniref:phosphonate C-P lyase system protein PhnG n=1 Tax=Aquitalea magnusonii TaxID=332411 RepID=UPI0007506F3A|nr:phosphonate C-P lyase system protein PhnG [Aquitalea magnusonii]